MVMMPLLAITLNSCVGEKMIDIEKEKEKKNEKTKLVKTMSYYFEEFKGKETCIVVYTYIYDDKKNLIRIDKKNLIGNEFMDNVNTFTYENSRIRQDFIYEGKPESRKIYTLDNNDYVTRIDNYDGLINRGWHTILEYSNGYLVKATYNRSDNDSPSSNTCVWENGNLIKINHAEGYTTTFTYGNVENKLNVNLPCYSDLDTDWISETGMFFQFFYSRNNLSYILGLSPTLKLKGVMTSKNLPIKITYPAYGETQIVNFSYTFDSDGYPTEIRANYEDKYIITYY